MTAPSLDPHATSLADLAATQRQTATRLLHAVNEAHKSGMSWRQIDAALGMRHETLFRQAQAGSPIVVVEPHQRVPG